MKIHFLKRKATLEQVKEMLESLESYIKLAVDVENQTLAGGGILHADCEAVLLENGSSQENIWGADWLPFTQTVTFESLINIRPRQNNFGLEVEDEDLQKQIEQIVRKILEGINYE
jgi:Protein of unknown function (DUF5674)